VTKSFVKKHREDRKLEFFDYYRIGFLNFLRGNYYGAYYNFKAAYTNTLKDNIKKKKFDNNFEANIAKWFIFSGMVVLFCENGKLDFTNLRNLKLTAQQSENLFFSCCSIRKTSNINNQNILSTLFNSEDITGLPSQNTIDPKSIAMEIEELLKLIKDNEKNGLEIQYI
jgi:hypothetical protein